MAKKDDKQITNQLHRIKGQLDGVERMVAECRNCEDILMQLMAARSSIEKVALKLLSEETESCVRAKDKESRLKLKNLASTLFKYT